MMFQDLHYCARRPICLFLKKGTACRFRFAVAIAIISFLSGLSGPLFGQQTYSWVGNSRNWHEASSWTPGSGPPGQQDTAILADPISGTDVIVWGDVTGNRRLDRLEVFKGDYLIDNPEGGLYRLDILSADSNAFRLDNELAQLSINGLAVNVANGGLSISDGATLNLGVGSGGESSLLNVGGNISIDAFFNIVDAEAGVIVSSDSGSIGNNGIAVLQGSGTRWNASSFVGVNGNLELSNGAKIHSQSGAIRGFATIQGAGTLWQTTGFDDMSVRDNGELQILDGGRFETNKGKIGRFADSGSVTVGGEGSEWSVSSDLSVGFDATGNLLVNDQGLVTSDSIYIGRFEDSIGQLGIEGGGIVTSRIGRIGYASGAEGIVTVSGSESLLDDLRGSFAQSE